MIISLLTTVLILVVAFWVVKEMALPHPIGMVVRIIVGVIGLMVLLGLLGVRLP